MADEAVDDQTDEVEDEEDLEDVPRKRFSGKVIVLYIVLPVLLLGGVGGGAAFFLGFLGGGDGENSETAEAVPLEFMYYSLPDLLVNLTVPEGQRQEYLKVRITLAIEKDAQIQILEEQMPRVIDQFQVYLRELRREDLNGSAGMFRLKEELLRRVNMAARPIVVHDVLFNEILLQ